MVKCNCEQLSQNASGTNIENLYDDLHWRTVDEMSKVELHFKCKNKNEAVNGNGLLGFELVKSVC